MRARVSTSRPSHPLVARALKNWRRATPRPSAAARALADAIAADATRIVFQPIVRLGTGRAIGAEALLRVDPDLDPGLPTTEAAIAVAEDSGLIVPLGFAILDAACAEAARWRSTRGGANWQVHVNVSPDQLLTGSAADDLERIVLDHGLPPSAVVIEVTETVKLDIRGPAVRALQMLESRGIELAIDDFGTGYASLDLLAAVPARTLKLDRSFVAAVGSGGTVRGRALVIEAAIGLGRSIGLRVVAEGVETESQAATLRAWGCHLAQGYLFGRPVEAERLAPLLSAGAAPVLGTGNGPGRLPAVALELAAAAAALNLAVDDEDGTLHAAVELTHALAGVLGVERDRADTNLLLAAAHGPHLPRPQGQAGHPAATLTRVLATPASGEPEAPIGALAALATELVAARVDGTAAEDALATRIPTLPDAAAAVVRGWWDRPVSRRRVTDLMRDAERQLRARDDGMHRLRAVLGMARVVGSSTELIPVLDAAAQEARQVLGAAAVSISHLERSRSVMRTLVNVGDLAPWEQRHPQDEEYALADFPEMMERVQGRAVHVGTIDDPEGDPMEQALMRQLQKGSWGAAPIVVDDEVWGELYAAVHVDEPAFTPADAPFLLAVAGLIGVAVARTEDLARLDQLVHQDPLTGLANRRRFETHATGLLGAATRREGPTLAMIDVNGLKQHNDEFGHAAGDALLLTVADVLARGSATVPGALAARLGGDEFGLAVPGGMPMMRSVLDEVRAGLTEVAPPRPRLSTGVVMASADDHDLAGLLARADAAQYDAKRAGTHVVVHGEPRARSAVRPPSTRDVSSIPAATALQRWTDASGPDQPVMRRLEGIADVAMSLLDLSRWVTSSLEPDGRFVIREAHLRRTPHRRRLAAPYGEQVHHLEDFPLTAEAFARGRIFVVDAQDPSADPDERALLEEDEQHYVIGLPVVDGAGRYLLELYGDDTSVPSALAVRLVEALISHRPGEILRRTDADSLVSLLERGA